MFEDREGWCAIYSVELQRVEHNLGTEQQHVERKSFLVLVLKDVVCLHKTGQLQLFQL